MWVGFSWLRITDSFWPCEHADESSGFIKGGDFLNQLSDSPVLKMTSPLGY
jgi:hypothetical protein